MHWFPLLLWLSLLFFCVLWHGSFDMVELATVTTCFAVCRERFQLMCYSKDLLSCAFFSGNAVCLNAGCSSSALQLAFPIMLNCCPSGRLAWLSETYVLLSIIPMIIPIYFWAHLWLFGHHWVTYAINELFFQPPLFLPLYLHSVDLSLDGPSIPVLFHHIMLLVCSTEVIGCFCCVVAWTSHLLFQSFCVWHDSCSVIVSISINWRPFHFGHFFSIGVLICIT